MPKREGSAATAVPEGVGRFPRALRRSIWASLMSRGCAGDYRRVAVALSDGHQIGLSGLCNGACLQRRASGIQAEIIH